MTFTLWFMGRPAAGKSTIAKRIEEGLRGEGFTVENLDGDDVRQNLHPDLGFTREDRALNNRRTAFICKLLNKNGVNAVTAMITPFRDAQKQAREIIEPEGTFVLVYVKCPVEECARRDPKNLYEQAQEGNIENFTGVSHPFQEPHNPDVVVDTEERGVDGSVEHVRQQLESLGVFSNELDRRYDFEISPQEAAEVKDRLAELGYLDDSNPE